MAVDRTGWQVELSDLRQHGVHVATAHWAWINVVRENRFLEPKFKGIFFSSLFVCTVCLCLYNTDIRGSRVANESWRE